MTDCLPTEYEVSCSIPVVVRVTADSQEEAERVAMSQLPHVHAEPVFADVAVGFPVVVEVREKAEIAP